MVRGPMISKPPASYKPELDEEERVKSWKFAAGSDKTSAQHRNSRSQFIVMTNARQQKAKINAIKAKDESQRTLEDNTELKKEKDRLSTVAAKDHTNYQKPENKTKNSHTVLHTDGDTRST